MTVQTTYATTHVAALAGMIADNSVFNSVSKRVDEVDGIGFGLGVVRSAGVDNGDSGIELVAALFNPVTDFIGFTVRTLDRVTQTDDSFELENTGSATVMTMGKIHVPCPTGCVAGEPVFIRTDAGFEGQVRNDATGGAVQVAHARFENTIGAAADALAKISVGLGLTQ